MKKLRWLLPAAVCLVRAGMAFTFSHISAQALQAYLAELGPWAPVGYILLFALLPAVFFPVSVLALAGRLLFELLWGSLYTFIGAMFNCTLMFLLSRSFGRVQIHRYVSQKLPPVWLARLRRLFAAGAAAAHPRIPL